jgi:Sugar-tranasporters, 12 TM
VTHTHTLPWWGSEQGLGQTFSWAVFLGNGLMAIAAGFIGDGLVERAGLGRVAPFDAAIVAMLAGGARTLLLAQQLSVCLVGAR